MTAQPVCAPTTSPAPQTDAARLDRAVRRLPAFGAREYEVAALDGGLTNRSYKVTAAGVGAIVVRISADRSDLLAIDRTAECHNARAARRAGVAPEVVACHPEQGVSIVTWIEGRTLTAADLDDRDQLARIAAMCRRLHAGPRFTGDFDMFDIQQRYLAMVRARGLRLPADYLDFMPQVARIRTALAVQPCPTVPCHNDLLAANIMDDGDRLWLIDYEYAGNNDPCFELGNLWSESSLPPARLDELVDAYFGRHSPARTARARLFAVMSKYGWTLWASIQDFASEVDFDFWEWGMQKYERAVEEFTSREFSHLIEAAQQPN